jgi:DNA-binding transcriptional LysR family regulator
MPDHPLPRSRGSRSQATTLSRTEPTAVSLTAKVNPGSRWGSSPCLLRQNVEIVPLSASRWLSVRPTCECKASYSTSHERGRGWQLRPILLDGNTEAAFSAELVTAVSTEIGMGFVPISICWHAMNGNLIPGVALRAVLFKGAGNFVWIVAHCCSPSF